MPNPFEACSRPTHYTGAWSRPRRRSPRSAHVIRTEGLPEALVPLVCGFTGYGHVSQGAQEIFDLLPMRGDPARAIRRPFVGQGELLRPSGSIRPSSARSTSSGRASPRRLFDLQGLLRAPGELRARSGGCPAPPDGPGQRHLWSPALSALRHQGLHPGSLRRRRVRPRLRVVGDISCDIDGGDGDHRPGHRPGRAGLCL